MLDRKREREILEKKLKVKLKICAKEPLETCVHILREA